MSLFRKTIALIVPTRAEAGRAAFVVIAMTFGAAFEALGIGLIMPFIGLLQRPELASESKVFRRIGELVGIESNRGMICACAVALATVFVIKNIYLSLVTYWQFRFISDRQMTLSRHLVETYMRSPYAFHLRHNSSELIYNVNYEISQLVNHVFVSIFVLLVEGLSVIVIAGLLVVLEPVTVPLVGITLGGVSYLFYRVVHKQVLTLGKRERDEAALMHKWLQQGLGGVKEARVIGCEGFFVDAFDRSSILYNRSFLWHRVISLLPRYALETFGVVGLIGVCVAMLMRGGNATSVMPILGVLAITAVRIIPSIARVLGALTDVRHHSFAVDAIHRALHEAPRELMTISARTDRAPAVLEREIRLEDVHFKYESANEPVLRGVSLTIKKGESIAFVGSSGAGKTTLVDLLIGLLEPTSGHIAIDGIPLGGERMRAWQRAIGYIPQQVFLCDDSVLRNVAFGIADSEIDRARVWRALETARLDAFVRGLPEGIDTFVGERGVRLSGGQRQRIGIARALYLNAKVLVLDEATSSLDGTTEREIVEAIDRVRVDRTCIVVAHRLSTVRSCDRLVFMSAGRVAQIGTWDELFAENREFRRMVESAGHRRDAELAVAT